MVRVAVTGASGRMGAALVRLAASAPDVELVGVTSRKPAEALAGLPPGVWVREDLAALLDAVPVDVVVDFTLPEVSVAHAQACAARGVALVCGTTGLSAGARAEVEAAATRVPVVLSPNMSVGVNVLLGAASLLARALGEDFDVEVLEAHHRMKRDAPSGTALRLADELLAALGRGREDLCLTREGNIGARPARQLGVQTLRGGDVVGEHTVYFLGDGERVELTHRATSRDIFASGALRAARWVKGRPAGLYDMPDVLGLRETP
jgi:4-hydroxy-tetrahydrodipicolinate reductase